MAGELKRLLPPEFPSLLREISDPPKELWVRGTLPPENLRWLTVVGSRACTPYGIQALRFLINGLKGYPVVIVSGLAFGIDAEAHATALEVGLPVVAVPGSGLDWNVMYPRTNLALARDIERHGGAFVSEFAPSTRAAPYTFPRRNRVMVGLSHAVLMIEAKERSGSLITARFATEYNRELLVVPGSIFSESSKGTHQFLKLGATPVTEPGDIVRTLGINPSTPVSSRIPDDISAEEARVLALLSTPVPRDILIDELLLPITDAHILLSTMEIKGLITEELGTVRAI